MTERCRTYERNCPVWGEKRAPSASTPAAASTRPRTWWNNQHTGIVDGAVFELKMEPANWGKLVFTE